MLGGPEVLQLEDIERLEAQKHQLLAIEQEYQSTIDRFSKQIITSHVDSLLNYADRCYHRQFITREKPTTRRWNR